MFKLSTLTLPFLSAMLFFPVTANALDINSPQFKSQLQSDAKASLEAPQTAKIAMIEKTPESDLTSRTTVKKLDIFTVIDENGKRYRNHTLAPNELTLINQSYEFSTSYFIEVDGVRYINRTVK